MDGNHTLEVSRHFTTTCFLTAYRHLTRSGQVGPRVNPDRMDWVRTGKVDSNLRSACFSCGEEQVPLTPVEAVHRNDCEWKRNGTT